MRRFLREVSSSALYPFLAKGAGRTVRVLTYHRVNGVSPDDRLSVKTSAFRQQMAFLSREGYKTLTPDGLSEILSGKTPLPEKSVLITFDDGYRDNFTEAFPVLKELGFQATVFVATDLVGKTHDGHTMLTWKNIKEMAQSGIAFGSHTVHHARMDGIPKDEKTREALESKQVLEKKLRRKVISLCYPFGGVDDEAKAAVRAAGYHLAFTTKPGPVRTDSDPFLLPRTEVSGFDTLFDFRKKLAGAFDGLHALLQWQKRARKERKAQGRVQTDEPVPVLYVIWSLGLGGAEQVVMALAKGLGRKRFRPLVACLNDAGPFSEALEKEGIRVFPLQKRGKFDFSILLKLVRLMKENRVGIVHTHLWGGNVWGRIAGRLAGVPVIVASEHSYAGKPKLYYPLDWFLSWVSDRIIVVSEKVREFYAGTLKIRRDKLRLIYNGIDTSHFEAKCPPGGAEANGFRRELGLSKETPLLGTIGRLTAVKAHEVLFDAIVRLKGKYPSLTLAVIGDGERQEILERLCRTRSIASNVRFLGLRKDVAHCLQDLDMVVVSSDREGLSMTVLEAMAAGRPVVATEVGGTPELVVDRETGFLVPPRRPGRLAERIDRLLRNRALARQMGESGRKRVREHFSLEKMVRETETLYDELLQSKEQGQASAL